MDNQLGDPTKQDSTKSQGKIITLDQLKPPEGARKPQVQTDASLQSSQSKPEGGIITLDQLKTPTIKQSGKHIQKIVKSNYDKFLAQAKQDASMGRLLSSAEAWAQGITKWASSDFMKSVTLHSAWFTNWVNGTDLKPEEMSAYKMADQLGKYLEESFPDSPLYRDEFWAGQMAHMSGAFTGQVVTALAGGAAGLTGKASFAYNSLAGINISSQFYEAARRGGASSDEALGNMLLNEVVAVPAFALGPTLMARRLNNATGGGLVKLAEKGFKGSLEQGFGMALATFFNNLVDKNTYDSTRDLMENVVGSGFSGAILGGFSNLVTSGLIKKQPQSTEELLNTRDALEMIDRDYAPIKVDNAIEFMQNLKGQKNIVSKGFAVTKNGFSTSLEGHNHAELNKGQRAWRKFMSSAPEGEAIRNMDEYTAGVIKSHVTKAVIHAHRLNEAILDYYDVKKRWFGKRNIAKAIADGKIPKSMTSRIDGVLRGETGENAVPQKFRKPIKDMRTHMDELSVSAAAADIVQGDLKVKFIDEAGEYIHRSYRLWDPEVTWGRKDIAPKDWNKAVRHVRDQLKALEKVGKNASEETITRKAEGELKELLEKKGRGSLKQIFLSGKKAMAEAAGSKDVIQQRQKIHPAIRRVMGEYTDPIYNYINTVEKQSNFIFKKGLFNKIAKTFKGQHFFTRDQVNQMTNSKEFRYQLDTGTGSKLDNMFMHEDMMKALGRANDFSNHPGWLRAIYTVNGLAKYSKTALSHVTVARNIVGGSWFLGFNGLLFNNPLDTISKAGEARKIAFKSIEKLDAQGLADKKVEYQRLLGLNKNIIGSEILESVRDGFLKPEEPLQSNYKYVIEGAKGKGLLDLAKKAGKPFKKFYEKAGHFYHNGDNFIRVLQYELELQRMQKADPSITKEEVAAIVNDTYQNYDRVNQAVKFTRDLPFAPFVAFPADLIRTSINTAKRVNIEMNSENPAMKRVGFQRLAGMLVTSTAALGAGVASMMANNIDDKQDKAYRKLMAPWDKNGTPVYFGASRGVVKFTNTSYTNPYSFLTDPIFTLLRTRDEDKAWEQGKSALKDLFDPLMSQELVTKALGEVAYNQTENGNTLYNSEAGLGDKMMKSFIHLWKSVEPGTITSGRRLYESTESGSSRKPQDELLGFFGLRVTTLDVRRSFGFKIRDLREQIKNTKKLYNSAKFNESSSRPEINQAFSEANTRYEELFNEMKDITDAAQKAGVPWRDLEGIMKDSGLANRDINAIRSGVFQPFKP